MEYRNNLSDLVQHETIIVITSWDNKYDYIKQLFDRSEKNIQQII